MPDEPTAEVTRSLAERVSNAMVGAQKEHFGRGPVQTKSYFVDDLLFIVMRGTQTRAEQTMLNEFGQADVVRQFRQTFANHMTARLTGIIEELTGRTVLTYQAQVLFDPDMVVQIFVFDRQLVGEPNAPADEASA